MNRNKEKRVISQTLPMCSLTFITVSFSLTRIKTNSNISIPNKAPMKVLLKMHAYLWINCSTLSIKRVNIF